MISQVILSWKSDDCVGACVVAKQGRFGKMMADSLEELPAKRLPEAAVQVRPLMIAPI